ncbi:hypothetical protein Hdeb2414_s0010g00330441 [Helianthus debilis subsp. tardiflorus]
MRKIQNPPNMRKNSSKFIGIFDPLMCRRIRNPVNIHDTVSIPYLLTQTVSARIVSTRTGSTHIDWTRFDPNRVSPHCFDPLTTRIGSTHIVWTRTDLNFLTRTVSTRWRPVPYRPIFNPYHFNTTRHIDDSHRFEQYRFDLPAST